MEKRAVLKNYGLLGAMLAAMLTGGVTGWLWPAARRDPPPAGANFHQPHVLRGGAAGVFLHRRSHRRDAERPPGRAHHGRHGADPSW